MIRQSTYLLLYDVRDSSLTERVFAVAFQAAPYKSHCRCSTKYLESMHFAGQAAAASQDCQNCWLRDQNGQEHPPGGLEGHDDATREGLASFPDELHEKLAHHF